MKILQIILVILVLVLIGIVLILFFGNNDSVPENSGTMIMQVLPGVHEIIQNLIRIR